MLIDRALSDALRDEASVRELLRDATTPTLLMVAEALAQEVNERIGWRLSERTRAYAHYMIDRLREDVIDDKKRRRPC